ncbi:MAG TPA: VOC family protein [Steroidobacteraceae bacterium]
MKVIHFMIPEDKFGKAVRFYSEDLGLRKESWPSQSTVFTVGSQKIELVPVSGPLNQRDTYVTFHVHGLDECIRHLSSKGYIPRLVVGPVTEGRGGFEISDPGGNIIILKEAED